MSTFIRNLVVWVILGSLMIYVFNNIENSSAREQISYSQFKQELLSDKIIKVVYKGDQMTIIGDRLDGTKFETTHPIFKKDDAVDNAIEEHGVIAVYEKVEQPSIFSQLLVGAFPIILLLAIFFFFMRQMQGGISGKGGPMSFGRSKAKLMEGGKVKTTFKDVAGCEEAKQDVSELIDFLKDPTKFQKLGGKIPRGVLMVGPPGTGKTLIARAVAGEARVPFFSISGSDFVEMFVGVGASRVRDMFDQAKKQSPCIVFIDEIDAVGRHRGAGLGGGHDEREQTLNALLVEMDGFESNEDIILMAATNRPDVLDAALLRPGRFDRQIVVDVPDLKGRLGILEVHTKKIVMNKKKVNLESIAQGTPGMVGADLENIVNEAALLAARRKKKSVDMSDFEEAKDKVMMGVQRSSVVLSDEEKRITAYHEGGHTLVAAKTKGADPVHKVTIIPRGRALGVTMQLPIDEKHGYSREYINGRLAILMGGRAAEELIFNEMTTGAGNDIEQATSIARKMVCEWGMSDVVGPMTFGKKNEEVFLGREIQSQRDYSEDMAKTIDDEVVKIVRKAQATAKRILKKDISKLHGLADALLEKETIDGDDVQSIVYGSKASPSKNGTTKKKSTKKTVAKK